MLVNETVLIRLLCSGFVYGTQELIFEINQEDNVEMQIDLAMPDDSNFPPLRPLSISPRGALQRPRRCGMGAALADVNNGTTRFTTSPAWTNDYDKDSCDTWKKNVLGYYRRHKGFTGDCQVIW